MESIKELYKIGLGPSSSHTMGPNKAAKIFQKRNPNCKVTAELFGSLALTGRGHLTDVAIKRAFSNQDVEVIFNYDDTFDYHSNAMRFKAYDNGEIVDEWLVFSVGGGDLKEFGEPRGKSAKSIYPHHSMTDILAYIEKENITLAEYVYKHENNDIKDYLTEIFRQMKQSVQDGLNATSVLPGRLQLKRKCNDFLKNYHKTNSFNMLIYANALAVSEQNASGETVVTAPTCGSSGVMPGCLVTYQQVNNTLDEDIIDALAVAGIVGNLAKHNASISGAEVGCQGEIGVACSMASAAIAYLQTKDPELVEYAAEIALEHHLGMTCDPIDGMVQIPCIERNAISAVAAFSSANYAIASGKEHFVTLDSVIKVMKDTGHDLQEKYKETSIGGLALHSK